MTVEALIYPSAAIDAGASIGRGTSIGPRSRVAARARVGAECVIDADVLIDADVAIGDRARIQDRALLYAGATVEDGVLIGAGAILTNDRYPRAITTSGDLVPPNERPTPVTLRRGSTIGAGAVIVAGLEVGEFATVGAGAVVTHDVPSHALVAGNPARRLGWVCSCGMRLVDDAGAASGPEPAHYSRHPELRCPSCDRVFVYVPDAERLEERPASQRVLPA
jgi:UDP-2-acetamido-3-amino-2,3-dideoxy-glucuronate N-acetyltransferase